MNLKRISNVNLITNFMKGERKSIRCKEFKNFEFLENSSDLVSNRSNTFEPWETNEKK